MEDVTRYVMTHQDMFSASVKMAIFSLVEPLVQVCMHVYVCMCCQIFLKSLQIAMSAQKILISVIMTVPTLTAPILVPVTVDLH